MHHLFINVYIHFSEMNLVEIIFNTLRLALLSYLGLLFEDYQTFLAKSNSNQFFNMNLCFTIRIFMKEYLS